MIQSTNESTELSLESDLHRLFVDGLFRVHWAEMQFLKAIPAMIRVARSMQLKDTFVGQIKETEFHMVRLHEIFKCLGLVPRAKKCETMDGLLKEGAESAANYSRTPAVDAALIAAAQKIEHHKIATYESLWTLAIRLGCSHTAQLLYRTLREEVRADECLTKFAEAKAQATAVQRSSAPHRTRKVARSRTRRGPVIPSPSEPIKAINVKPDPTMKVLLSAKTFAAGGATIGSSFLPWGSNLISSCLLILATSFIAILATVDWIRSSQADHRPPQSKTK